MKLEISAIDIVALILIITSALLIAYTKIFDGPSALLGFGIGLLIMRLAIRYSKKEAKT